MNEQEPQRVRIVDLQMPFLSMVAFMIKWAIAAIPAVIILMSLVIVIAAVVYSASGIRTS